MKISFGSWAFAFGPYADHPVPFDAVARRIAEAGYDGVEISGFPPHVSLDQYPTSASRRQISGLLKDLNLGVSCFISDMTTVNPVVPGRQEKYLELFRRHVELCVDIGSPAIRVDSVAAPGSIPEDEYQASMDRVADTWHGAAAIAEDAGVRVVWEFEPGFAFNKPSEVVYIHEKVAHWNFKLIFDTSHAYMCSVVGARHHGSREVLPGGPSELLQRLAPRIGHVHVIDSDGSLYGDETSTHTPFGQGKVDFRALAPRLLALPGVDWWCVDLCFCAGSWDLVESSLEYVRKVIAEASPSAP